MTASETSTGNEIGHCGICGFAHTYNEGARKGCWGRKKAPTETLKQKILKEMLQTKKDVTINELVEMNIWSREKIMKRYEELSK